MRFLPRTSEPVEPSFAAEDAAHDRPLKAQNVLGSTERRQSTRPRQKEPPETYIPTGSPPPREDQTSPSPMLPPLNPTEPLSLDYEYTYTPPNPLQSNPPAGNGRMSPFPNMQTAPKVPPRTTSANDLRSQAKNNGYSRAARQPQRGPPRAGSSSAVQPHQFYPDSQPSIESLESKMREYYDATAQPLSVSQQTSASAVRDNALRKGSPIISLHGTSSDPTLARSERPLKSAMKKQASQDGARRREGERKRGKLDFGSLFTQQQKPTNAGDASPATAARAEQNFDFFPEETVHAKLQRPRPHARFETQKSITSNSSDNTVREKVFEKDIYDNNKMHVRRPPKGIQNWFDGFDISSDEEERMYAREKVKVKKEPPAPVELPAVEAMQRNEPLPSTFSPFDGAFHYPQQPQQWPAHKRKASIDPVEDNLLAIEHAKEMMKQRAQRESAKGPERHPAPASATASSKQHRESESRLAHSRLASQSVLSLSSESGGEEAPRQVSSHRDSLGDESVILGDRASAGKHRSQAPPRRSSAAIAEQQENPLRRSISTTKTSGSIPMRLGSDVVPIPPLPSDHDLPSTSPRTKDSPAQALRRLNGISNGTSHASRSRRTTRSAPDDAKSTADRSLAEETTSSATDGSRIMQVSEEEMILLELMRQKRAAMQKNSFSEGYRLALKQEQDHLAKRREGAHRTALQVLKAKEEMMKRQSATSTVFSEDSEKPALAAMRRKYSALHREDVDKALKLERFLSLDPHGQVQVVPGADHFPGPPIVVEDEEESVAEEQPPVLLQARTYSPMQKLTQKVRDGGSRSLSQTHSGSLSAGSTSQTTPPDALSEEYLEDHHERVRAFLAMSSASEAQELFPTPPNHARGPARPDEWQKKAGRVMSPSPVLEEEPIVNDDDAVEDDDNDATCARDSRYPSPLQPRHNELLPLKKSPRPLSQDRRNHYRLSYTPDSDPLLETIGGLAPPDRTNSRLRDPYPDITPTLDAGPLELPSGVGGGLPGSPSLSSRPSPVTPTFPQVPQHSTDKTPSNLVEIAGSGGGDRGIRMGRAAYTPSDDTDFSPSPAAATAHKKSHQGGRQRAAGPPPPVMIDAVAGNGGGNKRGIATDRSSTGMSSITSAGEDVLAAWAELGGGTGDVRKVGGPPRR